MAYNFTNLSSQALQNMLPLFGGGLSNTSAAVANPNFINQLAAAISNTTSIIGTSLNATPTCAPSTITTTAAMMSKREKTPDAPPAPKISPYSSFKVKPNQGLAPMDLEIDLETETEVTNVSANSNSVTSPMTTAKMTTDKLPLNMNDSNLYLSGLMSAGMNAAASAASYMFFPTAPTSTSTNTSTNASILMDPSAMMAAAMQQIQQGYAGYSLAESAIDATNTELYGTAPATTATIKEVIKTKSSTLFPPNPNAPPPTIRERPLGCRTVFVGGLPENITEEIIREIFESCGEITTLRMSKKNFCHIRYRHESSIDRAIYLSGYRVRISNVNEPANYGRLHVDYAQARDDQYDYECKQRQLQREQRHRERMSHDRLRSQSPPPIPHYTDHEASLVAENLRNNETFVKAIQTIASWLERGDCTKRNANMFYSMIQSTHAHVRRLHTDKQQLEDELRKARESYRKQMQTMSVQFTQIEKVFSAASHKKCWDHFTKAQRKNIDQWKKLASELRSVQIEDDEMEISDEDRDSHSGSRTKRARYDCESLKEENDSLRCQLEAIRNEMSLERTDIKYDSDFREKQIKVLQETIRNMQTQLLQSKVREQKDALNIELLERKLTEAGVRQLLLKTKIKETAQRLKDKDSLSPVNSESSEILLEATSNNLDGNCNTNNCKKMKLSNDTAGDDCSQTQQRTDTMQVFDIDIDKSDDDVKIIEENADIVIIHEIADEEQPKIKLTENLKDQKKSVPQTDIISKEKQHTKEVTILNEEKSLTLNTLANREVKIVALTSAFLVVQPLGVTTIRIYEYLTELMPSSELTLSILKDILEKYSNLFEIFATHETKNVLKWKFCGFLSANIVAS